MDNESSQAMECIIQDAFTFAENNPGKRAFVFTKDYPNTYTNIYTAGTMYPSIRYSIGQGAYKLENGASVAFRHCEDFQGYEFNYSGAEWHWIAFNPDNHPDETTMEMLKRRIKEYRINAYCDENGHQESQDRTHPAIPAPVPSTQ